MQILRNHSSSLQNRSLNQCRFADSTTSGDLRKEPSTAIQHLLDRGELIFSSVKLPWRHDYKVPRGVLVISL